MTYLGKYELLHRLALGGMGELFLARSPGPHGFEKKVVIKRLHTTLTDHKDVVSMFLDEARIAAQLNHPNIVQIYELGSEDGNFFIAMEYIHGRNLKEIQERESKLGQEMPHGLISFIVSRICRGLHYAHTFTDDNGQPQKIVHRDVSPQNVLLSFQGEVKLVDFGIAKATSRAADTQAGLLKGKCAYMSPEQCLGHDVDARSDIFSVGILLHELTCRGHLFRRQNDFATMRAIIEDPIPPPSAVADDVPDELEMIITKALARDTSDRYQSIREMQHDLEQGIHANGWTVDSSEAAEYMASLFDEDLVAEKTDNQEVEVIDTSDEKTDRAIERDLEEDLQTVIGTSSFPLEELATEDPDIFTSVREDEEDKKQAVPPIDSEQRLEQDSTYFNDAPTLASDKPFMEVPTVVTSLAKPVPRSHDVQEHQTLHMNVLDYSELDQGGAVDLKDGAEETTIGVPDFDDLDLKQLATPREEVPNEITVEEDTDRNWDQAQPVTHLRQTPVSLPPGRVSDSEPGDQLSSDEPGLDDQPTHSGPKIETVDPMEAAITGRISHEESQSVSGSEAAEHSTWVVPDAEAEHPTRVVPGVEAEYPTRVTTDAEAEHPTWVVPDAEAEHPTEVGADDAEAEHPTQVGADNAEAEHPTQVDSDDAEAEYPTRVDSDDAEAEHPTRVDSDDAEAEHPTQVGADDAEAAIHQGSPLGLNNELPPYDTESELAVKNDGLSIERPADDSTYQEFQGKEPVIPRTEEVDRGQQTAESEGYDQSTEADETVTTIPVTTHPVRSKTWLLITMAGIFSIVVGGGAALFMLLGENVSDEREIAVEVQSTPSGATVYLDGEKRFGKTPTTLYGVMTNKEHYLVLTREGYNPWSKRFKPRPNKPKHPIRAKLEASKTGGEAAVLVVETQEPGANVFLDGELRGMTPLTLEGVSSGIKHTIVVTKTGFEEQAVAIDGLKPKEKRKIELQLKKVTKIREKPTKRSKVRVDRRPIVIPRAKVPLTPLGGKHVGDRLPGE